MTDKMTAEQVIRSRCQALACEPEIYNALGSFGNDPTEANAISVIQAVAGQIERQALTAPRVPEGLEDYDAGLLNDYGGGNVSWWHDYIRYEVDKANDWWRQQVEAENPAAPAPADELATLRERVKVLEEQWAVVFDGYAVMGHMESKGQYAHPPLICATLDAVAAIGKERAASLRGGSDE
jgi:hypothetical protein